MLLTTMTFVFARTGHIWKDITHRTVVMQPYHHGWETYLWDVLFYLQITKIFLCEIYEVARKIHQTKGNFRRFVKVYINFWNIVDWISILYGYVILVLWIFQVMWTEQLADSYAHVQELQDSCGADERDILNCNENLKGFFSEVGVIGDYIRACRIVQAFYPLVIVLRLFKAFSAQPRLAVVTDTLVAASSDLCHFSLVFLAVFMSFAVMGTALFGRELSSFTTIARTAFTLFRSLMGDFDLDSMRVVGRELAFVYFAIFMCLVLLIMLNMLIAVLMDVYSNVKNNIEGTATLLRQASDITRRAQQNRRGVRVPFQTILDCIKDHYGDSTFEADDCLTVAAFVKIVPNLREKQARRTLTRACEAHGRLTKDGPNLSNIMAMVSVLKKEQGLMRDELKAWRDPAASHLKPSNCSESGTLWSL